MLFVLGIFAFAGDFDPVVRRHLRLPTGDPLFWPSFIGAALIVLSNPVSFGAFLGDWSRYIPAETPRRRVMGAAFLAQIATLLPFVFGLATASIIATKAATYVDPPPPTTSAGCWRSRPAGTSCRCA